MKRTAMILLALCLSLTGCGKKFPEQASDGTPWDSGWVLVGDILGVDTPAGMDSRENDDIMISLPFSSSLEQSVRLTETY